jgi:peptidoglycan/xylan/chitin deacetylase (PgdA/CDA1 family)
MSQVKDGSIILLHDIHPTTVQAMERVIPSLIKQGFQLVTVSELLDYKYGGLEAGTVFGSYCAFRVWD